MGLAHLLAVSGTHIAVVTGFLLVRCGAVTIVLWRCWQGFYLCGFVRVQTACTEGFAYVAGTIWSRR
ncbi:MAG: ComEC/Rec2 family competence protein [Phascolarctobacterium faecium]